MRDRSRSLPAPIVGVYSSRFGSSRSCTTLKYLPRAELEQLIDFLVVQMLIKVLQYHYLNYPNYKRRVLSNQNVALCGATQWYVHKNRTVNACPRLVICLLVTTSSGLFSVAFFMLSKAKRTSTLFFNILTSHFECLYRTTCCKKNQRD